jgi:SAM-dependent methyltransferase
MKLAQRAEDAPELLDEPNHNIGQLEISLRHVAQVNHWLGGTRAIVGWVARTLGAAGGSVLDLATGNAEVPVALARWARRRRVPLALRATDVHPQMLELARRNSAPFPEITVEAADALDLPYADGSFTVAVMTLALHHFEGANLLRALREAARVSRRGILVSELERGWPNYLGAHLLAKTWWRRDPLTRHDGPLSVLRSFTRDELLALAQSAGLPEPRVSRHFFFRLMLEAELNR